MDETFGRYRLLEPLGRGTVAESFKAKSYGVEGFEKLLVVKRIVPEYTFDAEITDSFVRETGTCVRLSHTNIVQVLDLGRVEDAQHPGQTSVYAVTEYVSGISLRSLIERVRRRSRQLPVGLCLYVAAEIAKGLEHAHRRCDEQRVPLSIVHRCLSLRNVLVSWAGEVKLADFGAGEVSEILRRRRGAGKQHPLVDGVGATLSPEQANGLPADLRSDIFSLGALVYELLAGASPFRALTSAATLERLRVAEFAPLEVRRMDVSGELAGIVRRAMALEPANRFESAGRMHEDLLAAMYAEGNRFSPEDFAEVLQSFREAEPAELDMADALGDDSGTGRSRPGAIPALRAVPPISERPEAQAPEPFAPLSEVREVSALIVDFGAPEASVPSDTRAAVVETMNRYGALVIDDPPEGIAAIFGLGESDLRDVETAVRCGLVALRQLGLRSLRPGAGVDSGLVTLHPGEHLVRDQRLESLIERARLAARSAERRCSVSRSASRLLGEVFVFEPSATHGDHETMVVESIKTSDVTLQKFVGREAELQVAAKVLAAATRRQLRVLVLQGAQGVGKTRLLYALDQRLRKRAYNIGFYLANCPPRGREVPLAGLTAMLRVLCGVQEGDSPERIVEVEPRLRAVGLTDEERGAVLAQLGAAGVPSLGPIVPPLRAAFARMIHRLSEDRLHLFVWDDAQSLDPETVDVLANAARRLPTARVVIVLSTRTVDAALLAALKVHDTIVVGELDDADVVKLIGARAGVGQVPEALVQFCQRRAGGHPLFHEHLVRELLDSGALSVSNGQVVRFEPKAEATVARPLRLLLATRLSRLDPELRAVVQAAAILGDPIDGAVLSAMVGVPLRKVDALVGELAKLGLMRRIDAASCGLSSPMLREAVSESMGSAVRRQLHAAAATAYEATLGARVDQHADRVAGHLAECGERARAAQFFALSGTRRLRSGQLEASVRDLMHALAAADLPRTSASDLCDWLQTLRAALHHVRAAPSLGRLLPPVLQRIDNDGALDQRVRARIDAASMTSAVHDFEAADLLVDEAENLAGTRVDLRRAALLASGEVNVRRGAFRQALEAFGEAAACGGTRAPGEEYRLEIGLAMGCGASGNKAQALAHLERATALSNPNEQGAAVEREKLRALVLHFSRDFEGAATAATRGVEIARAASISYEVALGLHNLGDSLLWLGDPARAHAAFRQSVEVAEQFGFTRLRDHDLMYLAFLEADQPGGSVGPEIERLMHGAQAAGYAWDALNGRYLLASLYFRRGEVEAARGELERVRALARESKSRLLEASAEEMLKKLGSAE